MTNYSRAEMKASAKSALKGNWKTAIIALLLAILIPSFVLGIVESIFGAYIEICENAGAADTVSLITSISSLISTGVGILIIGPLTVGFSFFGLRLVRGWEVSSTLPYRVFSAQNYGRITLTFFMMQLFIFLWSLLLIIPGIVKSFSYAMTPYILMDHPEMGWREAITESRRMMDGHKGRLFVLMLSFILWGLFVVITLGIGVLYVAPYMEATTANFYRALKEEDINAQRVIIDA